MSEHDRDEVGWAVAIARELLDVPAFRDRRWRHVQAVGALAERIAPAFGADGSTLVAAAWLHDIGYAEGLRHTGFHPLDGADELVRRGVSLRVACLVAHHSGAVNEASLRGLSDRLAAYADGSGAIRDALWACDMTTGPTGHGVDFEERLSEICSRYGRSHVVSQALLRSADEIRGCIERTRQRLAEVGLSAW